MNRKTVSVRVYRDITTRISTVLSAHPSSANEAVRLVDAYLGGDTSASSPDNMAMIAFSMIKVELDRAMDRSARARERARKNKESKVSASPSTPVRTPIAKTPAPAKKESGSEPDLPLTRRERRAQARADAKRAHRRKRKISD